jgi:threonine/homoserine/homoserine lactone efflux protein
MKASRNGPVYQTRALARIAAWLAVAAPLLLLTPGPAVLYVVARSVEQGRIAGLASVFGITTGTLVHVLASTLGLSALLASSAIAFVLVKYAGAAYLIYMGVRRMVNPKTALFFLAFLPQFVDPSRGAVPVQIAFLGLLFTLMGLTSDGLSMRWLPARRAHG